MRFAATHLPGGIINQLDCAADAVRRDDLEIAIYHAGNALSMLKAAQTLRATKRTRLEGRPPLRRVK
jgi:hypothetical protein